MNGLSDRVAMDDLLDLLDPGERARLDAAIPALRRLTEHAVRDDHHVTEIKESR